MTSDESQPTPDEVPSDQSAVASYRPNERESIAEAIVTAASSAARTAPGKLEPLYAAVDPDALNSLFDSPGGGAARRPGVCVTFAYDSYRVRVEDGDCVTVHRRSGPE